MAAADVSYQRTVDDTFRGTFEIHIFVAPLNAPEAILKKFKDVCATRDKMKALYLYLVFSHLGPTGSMSDARRVCAEDTELLKNHGMEVIRQKIEAVVGITQGVPEKKEDFVAQSPDHYFEYHIQVTTKAAVAAGISEGVITADNDKHLIEIARDLQRSLGVQVVVSWNAFKQGQRFLNTRTYGMGRKESGEVVDQISKAVDERTDLSVIKVIREFIASDDNKNLDAGWLEPLRVAA